MSEGSAQTAAALPAQAGERRQLTLMFADLANSTALASSMDPEDWHDVLDAYQHRVAAAVGDFGGVVTQFQGDGAVVYFGYPEAMESAGRDALSAGLAVIEAVAELGASLPRELGVGALQARAGVHTGIVVVSAAQAGGVVRLADIFGEAPNLAARLQAEGRPGEVIVSDATASLVSGYFELAPLGPLSLKGIPRPVHAYRVIRQSSARSRLDATPLTPFVPRPAEWSWLEAHWATAVAGEPRVLLLTGEPGIGKSRLMREFSAHVASQDFPVRAVYCSRRDFLSPLQPFGTLMGEVPRTPDLAAAWVAAQADNRPALFLVDDVHWADPSTIEAVELLRQTAAPLLVVMTGRPEIADRSPVETPHRLIIGRLDAGDAAVIIEWVTGAEGLAPDVRDGVANRAEGVPLFLEELARGVVEHGDSSRAIPATVSEVISARLDRLGDAKRVAQLASVIGRGFERDVLREISELDRSDLDGLLQLLIEHGILAAAARADGELWFRHALIQEASYSSLLRGQRRHAHGLVADVLIDAGRGDSEPQVVAYHLGAAGRTAEAVRHWRLASRNARSHARFREAAGHEREVLALLPSIPEVERDRVELRARSRLATCLATVDQNDPDALTEMQRVQELARLVGDRAELLRTYLVLLPWWQANANYAAINSALPEARGLATDLDDGWSVSVLAQLEGGVRIWQGQLEEGLAHLIGSFESMSVPLDSSLVTMPSISPPEVIVLATVRIGAALGCWLMGRFAEAARIAEDAREFAATRAVPQAVAVTSATAAIMAQLDGDRDRVANLTLEAGGVADDVANRQWRQWAAALFQWSGESQRAEDDADERLDIPGPLLRPYFLMLSANRKGMAPRSSLALLDEALSTARSTGERFCEAAILRDRGQLLANAGRPRPAARSFEEAVEVARHQGARALELAALTAWATLADRSSSAARADLEAVVELLAPNGPARCLEAAAKVLEAP